jgi:BRCT domain type II-containing protein
VALTTHGTCAERHLTGARYAATADRRRPPQVPIGAKLCLEGASFVITGVMESLGREETEDLIKQYGGRVAGAVSGKTTYLLVGTVLEDGRDVKTSKCVPRRRHCWHQQ